MASATRINDGQINFAGGVDSGKNPTIQTELDPTGLRRNQLAWAANATMRGGGVGCRTGWNKVTLQFGGDTALKDAFELGQFQGEFLYDPRGGFPYMVLAISGKLFIVHVESDGSVVEISTPPLSMTATANHVWFVQAEEFLIIQDGTMLPLFWM